MIWLNQQDAYNLFGKYTLATYCWEVLDLLIEGIKLVNISKNKLMQGKQNGGMYLQNKQKKHYSFITEQTILVLSAANYTTGVVFIQFQQRSFSSSHSLEQSGHSPQLRICRRWARECASRLQAQSQPQPSAQDQ